MINIKEHGSYRYAISVVKKKVNAPKYVIKQAQIFLDIANGKNKKYYINDKKLSRMDTLLKCMFMPFGLCAGQTVYEATIGYQWLLYTATIAVVWRNDSKKRKHETVILEICRKNYKTFDIAILFLLLFFMEPKFSKFFSVAPDGTLSREVKTAIEEIIKSSPLLGGSPDDNLKSKFKIVRDYIQCLPTDIKYIPLNYSNGRLDGRLPSVFLVDEAGALPNSYAIEAMRSGQIFIKNKLGCIISTKYPTIDNPFENEVNYAKQVLDGVAEDETVFALLYEPDNTSNWATDDSILEQANPAALENPDLMNILKKDRQRAIMMPSVRENFITKHCNIIYQGLGTEGYIDINLVQKCRVNTPISFEGLTVYVGVDLSMSSDNTSAAFVTLLDDKILAFVMGFVPEDRIEEKTQLERFDYKSAIDAGNCIACGGNVIDYGAVEKYVSEFGEKYKCNVHTIGYDRFNCMSSAQKWESEGFDTVEIKQHSSVLHPATKLLAEYISEGDFEYYSNKMLEVNFMNARCKYDTNMNRYVAKKHSNGKVDMVVSLINAVYLLEQNEILSSSLDWAIQS